MDQVRPTAKETFGSRLRALLEAKGLSQTEFAEKTGIERSELNRTINDKRNPQPQEIAWICAALGIEIEVLMKDLDLPAPLRRAIEEHQHVVSRVLSAEAERDEARALLKGLQEQLDRERKGHDEARASLERDLLRARTAAADELKAHAHEAAAREADLRKANGRLTAELNQRSAQLAQAVLNVQVLRKQIAGLGQQLAAAKSATAVSSLVAGLFGTVLGTAIATQTDDDDI